MAMATGFSNQDPSALAENRSSAQKIAWDMAMNAPNTAGANQPTNNIDSQKNLNFNAWAPQSNPQPQIITPPTPAPEIPEMPSAASAFDQFLIANGIDPRTGLPQDATNEWGDTFRADNAPPKAKPSGSIRDAVTRGGAGQAIAGIGTSMLMGGPVGMAMSNALPSNLGLIGGVLSGGGAFGSGKGEDQRQRDAWRRDMQQLGLIDENYQVRLPNGTYFDMGKDGNARLANGLRYYETDTNNPVTEHVIGMTKPIAAVLTAGDDRLSGDITAYLTNAAMQNGGTYEGARQAVVSMLRDLGINKVETLVDELQQLRASGAIDETRFNELQANALALSKKRKDEAIRTANAAIQQRQQPQVAQNPEQAAEQSPLLKMGNQQNAQSSRQTANGPQMAAILEMIRARQQQNPRNAAISTYSNARQK